MDIQEKQALIAEIERFKEEAMKSYVVSRWAESYTNTDPFGYVILKNENNKVWWMKTQAHQLWEMWKAAQAQAVPEGFVLVPVKNVKYFSNDGENYEIHDTLAEAKHEAECAIEHFSERLADQLCDPREDGNFQNVGYGVVLGTSSYSIDHVVTQEDVENGEYGYEVGTEIMSLFLVEAQELTHESK